MLVKRHLSQEGWYGHWRLASPLAIQVQVNGHCRRCLESLRPCLSKGGERCPSGDNCNRLQKCPVLRAKSFYRRVQACRRMLCPPGQTGKPKWMQIEIAQVSRVLEELPFSVLLSSLGVCDWGAPRKLPLEPGDR